MTIRRLLSTGLLASALVLGNSPSASASATSTEPVAAVSAALKKVGEARQYSAAGVQSTVDPTGDAPAAADITGTALNFNTSTLEASVTLATPPDPADPRWQDGSWALGVSLSFNNSGVDDGALILVGDGMGGLMTVGVTSTNECMGSYQVMGNTVKLSATASCFNTPGVVAHWAMHGDLLSAMTGNMGNVDLAPDFGYSASVAEPGGYWLLGRDGGVFAFGDAQFYGSTGGLRLNKPVVGMSPMPGGKGYRFVAADGGVFSYGNAGFHGSTGSMRLNQPVVGMTTTPSGNGYWLVASDGGIFAFGDAQFYGSTGSLRLNRPVVGMTATASGKGYWLVASDGGIFAFGDATFLGSTGGMKLNSPITSMATSKTSNGYLMLAADGGVFAYGSSAFHGSAVGSMTEMAMAAGISVIDGGYRIADSRGAVLNLGDTYHFGDLIDLGVSPAQPIVAMATL